MTLLRTAIALMGERGYDATTTRDIAAAADVSVAALYHHFPSKLDLLREFLLEAHGVVLARLEREIDLAGDDPADRLDAAVGSLIASSLHDEWAQLAANVAWREHGRLEPGDRRAVADLREQMVELIEGVLREGVAAATFTTSEPGEVARALLTLCISQAEPFPQPEMPMRETIALYQRFARALASPAGG